MNFIIYQRQKHPDDRNFTISEGLAYTEDNVLVSNLFLYKLPLATNDNDLKRYFSRFGVVTYARTLNQIAPSRRNTKRIGFVHFKDAKSACKALISGPHIVHKKRIGVKACDSWHQPTEAQNKSAESQGRSDDSFTADIFELNDYCLLEVCSYLNLNDQMKFARSCQRFRDVFVLYAKTKYKTVLINQLSVLTLWEARIFFEMVGPCIEKAISVYDDMRSSDRILEFMINNAVNLKHFTYDGPYIKLKFIRKLVLQCPLVESVEIGKCAISDNCLLPFQKFEKLRSLTLCDCFEVTGRTLRYLPQLTELNVFTCHGIQSSFMCATFPKLGNLKSLNIQRCDRLNQACFLQLAKHCQQLEKLEISWFPNVSFKWLLNLPKLRQLELLAPLDAPNSRKCMTDMLAYLKTAKLEHFKILGRNLLSNEGLHHITEMTSLKYLACCNNDVLDSSQLRALSDLQELEELVLMNTPSLTNSVLLQIIRGCSKLRKLDIQRCANVTDDFVKDCAKIFEKRNEPHCQAGPMLLVYAYQTGIAEDKMPETPFVKWNFSTQVVMNSDNYRNMDMLLDIYDQDLVEDFVNDDYEDDLYEYDSGSEFDLEDMAFVLEQQFDVGYVNHDYHFDGW